MRSSVFAKWVRAKKFVAYVALPTGISLVLILFYFSGVKILQQFVAPSFYGVDVTTSTKVGALELLQVIFLLGIAFFAVRCLLMCDALMPRLFYLVILASCGFVLFEETRLGAHYQDYFNRPPAPLRQANYGPFEQTPPPAEAEQVAARFNLTVNGALLALMVIAPLLSGSRNRSIRLITPRGWLSIGALAAGGTFYLAWHLNSRGFGMVDSMHGALRYDVGEFLALSVYWLGLLYLSGQHERNVARQ